MEKRQSRYSDIIDLPHHQSEYRPHMPVSSRAAQFAPFAALVGYEDMVQFTTDTQNKEFKRILDEDSLEILERKIQILKENLNLEKTVEVVYFDEYANLVGGKYVSRIGFIRKIEEYPAILVMDDGEKILKKNIVEIYSDIFTENE